MSAERNAPAPTQLAQAKHDFQPKHFIAREFGQRLRQQRCGRRSRKYLPAVDDTIAALADVLTDFEDLLVDLTRYQDTYNELGGPCTEYTLIFARGTTEPGNVGILVGPPLIEALTSLVGESALTIQGVNNYAASVDGYLEGGDPAGSAEM